jgi:hypothetical protein
MADHTGFIDEQTLDAAIKPQRGEPSKSLATILVTNGSITDEDRRPIEPLCDRQVGMRACDPERSLAEFSLAPMRTAEPTARGRGRFAFPLGLGLAMPVILMRGLGRGKAQRRQARLRILSMLAVLCSTMYPTYTYGYS